MWFLWGKGTVCTFQLQIQTLNIHQGLDTFLKLWHIKKIMLYFLMVAGTDFYACNNFCLAMYTYLSNWSESASEWIGFGSLVWLQGLKMISVRCRMGHYFHLVKSSRWNVSAWSELSNRASPHMSWLVAVGPLVSRICKVAMDNMNPVLLEGTQASSETTVPGERFCWASLKTPSRGHSNLPC